MRVSSHDHWYVNFGYYSDNLAGSRLGFCQDEVWRGYGEGGRWCRLNLHTGQWKVLLDDAAGGVR